MRLANSCYLTINKHKTEKQKAQFHRLYRLSKNFSDQLSQNQTKLIPNQSSPCQAQPSCVKSVAPQQKTTEKTFQKVKRHYHAIFNRTSRKIKKQKTFLILCDQAHNKRERFMVSLK